MNKKIQRPTTLSPIPRDKYIFCIWFTRQKDHFMQTMYQSPERFNEIAQFSNFDFQQKAGTMTSLPFHLSWRFTTRLILRYAFVHSRAVLTAYCQDLFQTRSISPAITWAHQRLRTDFSCHRVAGITFTCKFGGYKEKKREEVDTSRMRK